MGRGDLLRELSTTRNKRVEVMKRRKTKLTKRAKELRRLYERFRKDSPFMLVGENAKLAWVSAQLLAKWQALEAEGLVRIESEPDDSPDPSFYDTWEHLSERTREQLKADYCDDCWGVLTYWRESTDAEWQDADSIWGNSGYDDPCSPFENCYVVDLMRSAIDQLETAQSDRAAKFAEFCDHV